MSRAHYLKLYIGCMMSSKTSNLMTEINRYKHITDRILVINHILDATRHKNKNATSLGIIRTHDQKELPAIMINELGELKTNPFFRHKFENADIVIIDEGQFYKDLYQFMRTELFEFPRDSHPKTFIVAGLSGDYNMEPIGDIIQLVPLADEIHKLTAYCVYCKDTTPASFSKKIINTNETELKFIIGDHNIYSPVCRMHYLV